MLLSLESSLKSVRNKFGFRSSKILLPPALPPPTATATTASDIPVANSTTVVKHDTEPPQLSLSDVETRLNMHQVNGLFEAAYSATTPEKQNGRNGGGDGGGGREGSPDVSAHPIPITSNGEIVSSEWSAVGHATTGKSGRVIHNLQEDIARLTRECSLHKSLADEAQKINEALKIQLQNVTDRLRNSEQSHEANLNSIARKDRKIEDLKAEMQGERERRMKAEEDAKRTNQIAAQERDEHHRAFVEASEVAAQARNQYETLSRTRSREKEEYETRFNGFRDDIKALCERELERQNQLTRFDVIIEQKNREIEAERDRMERFGILFEEFKALSDEKLNKLIEQGKGNDETIDEVVAEAREVTGRMKWVFNVKNDVQGAE
ncbi:hypothetical protein AJ80_01569 [Polytolypa hystricis UAMH7299]|uniref:SWI5-dependent HO expression protein 3 n=1 Tax=Polytolypa hystricis (strain UAMH7299) TaxID=1447883 RepID=A0A2B7Z0Q1_POLH7|nr:hypothetical protein AJ80_01569 [Polytolypa hystricis UAMH7299]